MIHDPTAGHHHSQGHGGHTGTHHRLHHIGAHAGDTTHIGTDLIRYGSRILEVILGNASLQATRQLRANVGGFGKRSTAYARKQREGGHAQGHSTHQHGQPQNQPRTTQPQQTQPHRDQAGDTARLKGYAKARSQGDGRQVGCTGVGPRGDEHSQVTGHARHEHACQIRQCNLPAHACVQQRTEQRQDRGHNHGHPEQQRVLVPSESYSSGVHQFQDVAHDL